MFKVKFYGQELELDWLNEPSGYLAMDADGIISWFDVKPVIDGNLWIRPDFVSNRRFVGLSDNPKSMILAHWETSVIETRLCVIPADEEEVVPYELGSLSEKDTLILDLIEAYGWIDGAHHKDWVLDQIARVVFGATETNDFPLNIGEPPEEYHQWVQSLRGEQDNDGEYEYSYSYGIAP